MKTADFDSATSAVSKLIKYVVKGKDEKRSEYLSIQAGGIVELGVEINNKSIFVPGDNVNNTQNGFRRTDVLPNIDPETALVGVTAFHLSLRTNPQLPFNLKHGYLLSSIEIPSGDHVFDIFTGSDFDSKLGPVPTSNSNMIRIRNLKTEVLHSVELKDATMYNFAIVVDWKENMLTVYASVGDDELKKVAGPVKNAPAVISPEYVKKGEWHAQLIKFPLPNPADPVGKRSDVPHFGLQEGTHEGCFFSRMFVEDASDGKITTSVTERKESGVSKIVHKVLKALHL